MSEKKKLRSEHWFNDPDHLWETAIYVERYLNSGLTREELQAGKPIIGIAQTGGDLTPCNRIHVTLADRVREGIRDAGGIPFEFPVHPIAEQGKRPTSGLDRNLAYLGLVEILFGYPIDGVVLTTGCDKTTPSCMMAAATMGLPAIVLSGGPMLDNYWKGCLTGSAQWHAREAHAAGEIDDEEFMESATSGAPSLGHCNVMGTALSMNCLAEALGMSLPGCASIPAPYKERGQMAYRTGRRIVEMVHENLTPSKVMTREAFLNAVVVNSAIGGSTNCPIHLTAIARHVGLELPIQDFESHGHEINDNCILFIRGCGPVGYPGSAEVVSMHPPKHLADLGCHALPCIGDGRQSGTSASPSILNVCPEAAIGGGLALLQTGDRVRIDLSERTVNLLVSDEELQRRRDNLQLPGLKHQTPWQEIYRDTVGQLDTGACMELAVKYRELRKTIPRHAH